jgi:arginase
MTAFDEALARLQPGTVAIVGIPSDENSTFMPGSALAPPLIREALHSPSSNLCTENGLDLGAEPRLADLGDLPVESGAVGRQQIQEATERILQRQARLLALGGDHALTYPIVKAYAQRFENLNILHFDAHPDLYDEFEGNRYSHACPFARIMEDKLATRLVQVGIRTMNPHQQRQAERFGVNVIDMPALYDPRAWQPGQNLGFDGPVYVSLDLDALDPAYAPGVAHHEPGGLSTRQVLQIIHSLGPPIVGADIVEYNPKRDPLGITAMVAAKLLKEMAAGMIAGS